MLPESTIESSLNLTEEEQKFVNDYIKQKGDSLRETALLQVANIRAHKEGFQCDCPDPDMGWELKTRSPLCKYHSKVIEHMRKITRGDV